MTDPSASNTGRESGDPGPDRLERELSELTRPVEPGVDLFAKAWKQVEAEDVPRVMVLRRWLAPMAVAATLTLVGLAVTMNAPVGRRPVPSVAMELPASSAEAPAREGGERSAGLASERSEQSLTPEESATRQLAAARDDASKRADSDFARGRSIDDRAEEVDRKDTAAAAEARDAPGRKPTDGGPDAKNDQRLAKKAEDKDVSPDAEARRVKEEPSRTEAASAEKVAPPEALPALPPGAQVPVPGGSSSQNRANSQFSGRGWHQDQASAPQQAPGPEAVGRLSSSPRVGFDAGLPASVDAPPPVQIGWASRVFVQGRWWWLGIAATIVAFTLYWRRRLRAEESEPAPDQ